MNLEGLHPSLQLDLLALILGLCVGSFLNVVALRSLADISLIYPPSRCPKCLHNLAPWDNIPLLSWLCLLGKCRYCRAPIHWQYPVVELFTGLTFVSIVRVFLAFPNSPFDSPFWNSYLGWFNQRSFIANLNDPGPAQAITISKLMNWDWRTATGSGASWQEWQRWWYGGGIGPEWWLSPQFLTMVGVLVFACTLIAVTVTDFKEKLIPHEITYPSIGFGLLFSAVVRHDFLGAMVGVGASYLLFDFIAFYGLKIYQWVHRKDLNLPVRNKRLRRRLRPRVRKRLGRGLRWRLDLASIEYDAQAEEPMEVMGGGDAVLSAVMAAYLGWQLLVIALIIGFVAGTVMGLTLLLNEMKKAKLLHNCLRTAAIFALVGATALGVVGGLFPGDEKLPIVASMAVLGAGSGILLGIVFIGSEVSKPYPFGPALAAGGFIAMFLIPNWLWGSLNLH